MYEQMRKGATDSNVNNAASDDDEESEEGCTVEEVIEDAPKNKAEEAKAPLEKSSMQDQAKQMAAMINELEVEPEQEFVSNLEELD